MKDPVHGVGEWLGTAPGFWFNIGVALAAIPIAFVSMPLSTMLLSIAAIILPAFILKRDHDRDAIDELRDKAMHAKLDELLRGVPDASESLVQLEETTTKELA